ncbi:MAG: transposase [Desulfuromusa sp.]|nr:transposase [Desulfuromusa sp.]
MGTVGRVAAVKFDPDIHKRRSIRLSGYDYTSAGFYFITVCVQDRECLLGEIANGEMVLNAAGRMVERIWQELPDNYPGIGIDTYVVMPNHFHGIIVINDDVGAGPRACPGLEPDPRACPDSHGSQGEGHPQGGAPTEVLSLPDVVHRFKSLTTARYRQGVNHHNWPPFTGKLWQRNYYERIIRNEDELHNTRQYIRDNPMQWEIDDENPANHRNNTP